MNNKKIALLILILTSTLIQKGFGSTDAKADTSNLKDETSSLKFVSQTNELDNKTIVFLKSISKNIKDLDIDLVIKNGTNINAKDINGNTILILLFDNISNGHDLSNGDDISRAISAIRILRNADFDIQNNKGETALIKAIKKELDHTLIEELLNYTKKIDLFDYTGSTALMWSTWKSNFFSVNLLLAKFADVNIKNINGESFLDFIRARPGADELWKSYSKIYDHLKECKAKTNKILCDTANLSIVLAVIISDYRDIPIESQDKANLQKLMDRDWMPASCALRSDSRISDINKLNDINISNDDGVTPLIWAVIKGDIRLIEHILKLKANINLGDKKGKTALMYAASFFDDNCIDCLLKNGADINTKDPNGNTALFWFIDNISLVADEARKQIPYIKLFENSDFDIQRKNGETALMRAIRRGLGDNIIEAILKKSKRLNAQDNPGNTALILAITNGKTSIVDSLLNLFVDVNIKNKKGVSFLDLLKVNPVFDHLRPDFPQIRSVAGKLWFNKYSQLYSSLKQMQSIVAKEISDIRVLPQEFVDIISQYFSNSGLLYMLANSNVDLKHIAPFGENQKNKTRLNAKSELEKNPKCIVCESANAKLKCKYECNIANYCSRDCKNSNWHEHMVICPNNPNSNKNNTDDDGNEDDCG